MGIQSIKHQKMLNKSFKVATIGKLLAAGLLITYTIYGLTQQGKDTVTIQSKAYEELRKDKTIMPKELEIYKQMVKAKKITWEEAKKINDLIKDSLNIVKQIARESKFK